ncbi:MAG: hypothetical protein KDD47_10145, partial [Acidobacteria bacterium]|nr:hypothetical protein [Acidobacteriota bacterium]
MHWILALLVAGGPVSGTSAEEAFGLRIEVSDDGLETVVMEPAAVRAPARRRGTGPYPAVPDWQNDLRRQVGGLAIADMDGDGTVEIVYGRSLFRYEGGAITKLWDGTAGQGGGNTQALSY